MRSESEFEVNEESKALEVKAAKPKRNNMALRAGDRARVRRFDLGRLAFFVHLEFSARAFARLRATETRVQDNGPQYTNFSSPVSLH